MDKRKKGWLQAALVLVVAGATVALSEWVASLAKPPEMRQQAAERVIEARAERIAPTAHRLRFSVTGTVQVKSYVGIVPEVSGRVVSVDRSIYAGEHFDAGTELFRIDARDYEAAVAERASAVARARRTLEQRQAEMKTAKRQWKRLHPDTEPPPLVARIPQLEEARASLEAAKSALVKAKRDLDRTRFRFPFDGRVVTSEIEKGQFVTAGRSYGRVYRDEAIEVKAPLTAQQRDWLLDVANPEVALRVVQDAERSNYEGKFARMAAEAEPETRLLDAIFTFAEPPATVAPGEFVEVELVGPEIEAVWVLPVAALQQDETIWVVDDSGRLRSLDAEVVHVTDETLIAKGNGETILAVTQALNTATEGTKVEVRNAE
jgi:RND family efflux transporter MFP subunit